METEKSVKVPSGIDDTKICFDAIATPSDVNDSVMAWISIEAIAEARR